MVGPKIVRKWVLEMVGPVGLEPTAHPAASAGNMTVFEDLLVLSATFSCALYASNRLGFQLLMSGFSRIDVRKV